MSQENVEIVRRVFEAAADGDTAAVFALYDRDIEWDASGTQRGALTGKVVHGHDAVRAWLEEFYGIWEAVNDDLEELIEVDDDRVLSLFTQRGHGSASGIVVEERLGGVWTVRERKVVKVVWYASTEEALDACGLRE
jgi:ketosteroid isomerase-like protein